MPDPKALLTLKEAADILKLASAETFSRFAQRNGIPLLQLGGRLLRVRQGVLDKYLESCEEGDPNRRLA